MTREKPSYHRPGSTALMWVIVGQEDHLLRDPVEMGNSPPEAQVKFRSPAEGDIQQEEPITDSGRKLFGSFQHPSIES